MDKYHEEGKFRQWINAVTVNLCRDYFRSRGHRQDAVQIHDEEVLEGISSTARGQEEILDSKARQKVILKAVDDLPAKLRKIVILFEFEEFSYEQIAKKTGLSESTLSYIKDFKQTPQLMTLILMADAIDVSLAEVFREVENYHRKLCK